MANSDKNIKITPQTGNASEPSLEFTGADNNTVYLRTLDDGTLSFEASSGQLFSVSDNFTGDLYKVSDITGIPFIRATDQGQLHLQEFTNRNVLVGPATDNEVDKLQVYGGMNVEGPTGGLFNVSAPEANVVTDPGLQVNDISGAPMFKVDYRGHVTSPNNPLFFVNIGFTGSNNIGTSSTAIWTAFDTPLIDTAGGWDSVNSRYYAPTSGYYEVYISITVTNNGSGDNTRYVAIRGRKNGVDAGHTTTHGSSIYGGAGTAQYDNLNIKYVQWFDAGDYWNMSIDVNTVGVETTNQSAVCIKLIG